MKVEVSKEELLNVAQQAEKISGKNLTLPVLHCILLIAEKGGLTVRATNLELGIEVTIPAKVAVEGRVAVPGNVLSSVVSASSGNSVRIELIEGALSIEGAESKTQIRTYDVEEFPTLPKVSDGPEFTLSAEHLAQVLRSVSYSASLSTIKPELASVCLYSNGNELIAVATDSFRLAEKRVTLSRSIEFPQLLIPIRVVQDMVRVLETTTGDVSVRAGEHQVAISFSSTYLTSRLVEGSFPDYMQIIPKEFVAEVITLKQDVQQVLRKATIFSDKFNQITFHVDPKKKQFTIHAENTDVGETTDGVPAAVSGEQIDISFNQRYITDCFASIASDSISFSLAGLSRPMIIRGISDNSFFYLVMSMNK